MVFHIYKNIIPPLKKFARTLDFQGIRCYDNSNFSGKEEPL